MDARFGGILVVGITGPARLLNGADPLLRSDDTPFCSARFLSTAGKGGVEANWGVGP